MLAGLLNSIERKQSFSAMDDGQKKVLPCTMKNVPEELVVAGFNEHCIICHLGRIEEQESAGSPQVS